MCLNIMKLKLASACNVVNIRNTRTIPDVLYIHTFSNSKTCINSTAHKFFPAGANLKKIRGNVFYIRHQIRQQRMFIILYYIILYYIILYYIILYYIIFYYIMCCTGTFLNLFSVHSKRTFVIFPAREIK